MGILYNTTFLVAVAFVLFFAILWWAGVHRRIAAALDARAEKIRLQLEEARQLRDEAQKLLASYERKQKEVERLADEIVAKAVEDARAASEAGKAELERAVARRLKSAEEQIANAEAAAIRQVRDEAIVVAVAAAAEVMARSITDEKAAELADAAIAEVGRRLH
ncbi:MAG: ATP synthase subunit b 1 [Paracoccaceae bacterium]|nr:MAG: ATP synthase subunit b 1 [Paracoccaceae bacterium]